MATNVRLTELATLIQRHASMITSFGSVLQSDSVVSIHAVLETMDELQLLLRGPVPYLMDMVVQQVKISLSSRLSSRSTESVAQRLDQPSNHI